MLSSGRSAKKKPTLPPLPPPPPCGCRDRLGSPSRTCATSRARTHALRLARSRRVTRVAVSSLARRSPWQRFPLTSIWSFLYTKKNNTTMDVSGDASAQKQVLIRPFRWLWCGCSSSLPRRNVRKLVLRSFFSASLFSSSSSSSHPLASSRADPHQHDVRDR